MTAAFGRTHSKHVDFQLYFSSAWRSLPVDTINGLTLAYDVLEYAAFIDRIKTVIQGQPTLTLSIAGPHDTADLAAAGTKSGSHRILSKLVGGNTPIGLAVYFGIGHVWEAGEQVFGISPTSANGVLVYSYTRDIMTGRYSAEIGMRTGSAAPAWGTTAIT